MRIVAIINQKGGSGKTTTALNLGAALARAGKRALVVDLDPQSHCAAGLAVPEGQIELHVGDAMLASSARPLDLSRLVWTVAKDLHLLPSTTRLAALEAARGGLAERDDRDTRLASLLARFAEDIDWALLDCPPSIGLLTFNALRACTEVLIPVETGFFALQGAGKQAATIDAVARKFGVEIPYRVLPTIHDPKSALARDVLAQLESRFGPLVIPLQIRMDARLRESVSVGVPLVELDPNAAGARDYTDLAAFMVSSSRPIAPASQFAPPETMAAPVATDDQDPPHDPSASEPHARAVRQSPFAQRFAPMPEVRPGFAPGGRAAELAERASHLGRRAREMTRDTVDTADVVPQPPAATTASTPHARSAANIPPLGVSITAQGVHFTHPAPPSARVSIAGDHNGWSGTATPMRFNQASGLHEAHVALSPGKHRYRLVIDGKWITDPYNPVSESNPFGARDSIVIVPQSNARPALNSSDPTSQRSALAG